MRRGWADDLSFRGSLFKGPLPNIWQHWRNTGLLTWLMFGAVFLVLLLIAGSLTYFEVDHQLAVRRAARTFVADSRELLLREQQRLNIPDTDTLAQVPPSTTTPLAPARNEKELLRGMRTIVQEVGAKSRYRQAQVQARIEALHLDDLLLPENLLGAEGIRTGRATNRRYIALLNYSIAVSRVSQAELAQRLRALAGELPEGRLILDSHARNAARGMEEEIALLQNQRVVIGKIERVYNLVDARKDQIQLQDGTLVFEQQSDADEYNRLIREIQALAQQRAGIHQQQQARMDMQLRAIDKIRPH
ncbi:MAG: hypothetical protein ACREP7_04480 [Lysobacter sp.]